MPPKRVLIFGGTREARVLADLLADEGFYVVTALAGVTRQPNLPRGGVHHGRFGGADGITQFVKAEAFALIIDATHPFAAKISANIAVAAAESRLPCRRLERDAWQPEPGDQWTEAAGFEEAAKAVPQNARVFLTIGHRGLEPFLVRADLSGVVRVIEPPRDRLHANWQLIQSRPPHSLEEELKLLEEYSISVLVTKNAGGDATQMKLIAARQRGIPVVMIRRPTKPPMIAFSSAAALRDGLRQACLL